jgi:hypothetical protein
MRPPEYYVYDKVKKDVKFYDTLTVLLKFIKSACFDSKYTNRRSGSRSNWWWTEDYYKPYDFFDNYGHCPGDDKRFMVKDKWDRIVNKKDLRKWYENYISGPIPARPKRYTRYGKFVFRRGPVEGIHNYGNNAGQAYSGNHGSTTSEIRSYLGAEVDMREDGIKFKLNRTRNPGYLDSWEWGDSRGWNHIKKSWKRTRKAKQWM